jgi:hypothetical protein
MLLDTSIHAAVCCRHQERLVLLNYHFAQVMQEVEGVRIVALNTLSLHSSPGCDLKDLKGRLQVFLVEGISAVHAKVAKGSDGWDFHLAVELVVAQD